MKCNTLDLSVLAYANRFTLWHYRHDGNTASVGHEGFFDNCSYMLRKGDRIILQANDAVRDITVTESENGKVRVWLPGVFGEGFKQ